MRFLANENFPNPAIQLLRSNGFYVKSIREETPGVPDGSVLEIAKTENLIILTFDKDYGEIIFRYGLINPPAVIFFRYKGIPPLFAGNILLRLLTDKSIYFPGNFTIIEENNIRQRHYF
jgi:predicted nuclease of predicted toxin-antitoxin system